MRRQAFTSIFWGLLFVAVDIRIDGIDLILPDFLGYLLFFRGLTLLAPEHRSFRTARVIAAVMIVGSIPSLIEIGSEPVDPACFKRQWISALTGDLSALLPPRVHSARLLRTTHSRSSIDANRTQNPKGDEDAVLGQYSDGTVVLILRYGSPEEALRAFEHKTKTDYSFDGIRKRAETDPTFRAEDMSGSSSTSGPSERSDSETWSVEAADRLIQQWWNRGWSWRNLSDLRNKGGWNGSTVYIVEGYKSSAGAYKSALEGERHDQSGVTFNPLFPLLIIGEIATAMMIWAICSGIMALSLSSNQHDLMEIARRRRALFMALTVMGWAFSTLWFLAPDRMARLQETVVSAFVVCALLGGIAGVLIMALMRRAADALG